MKSTLTLAIALLLAASMNSESVTAVTLRQNSVQEGIFSKLIEEQQEEDKFVKDIEDAKLRKKQQLAEAE